MKRTFFLMAFSFACLTCAQASTIFEDTFDYGANTSTTEVNKALSDKGWQTGATNLHFTGSGVTSNNWQYSRLYTNLAQSNTIKLGTTDSTYQFSFSFTGTERSGGVSKCNNNQDLFCLAGSDFSLLLGHSYTSNSTVALGTAAENVFNAEKYYSFQDNTAFSNPTTLTSTLGTPVSIPASPTTSYTFSYLVTLTTLSTGSNMLSYTVDGQTVTYNFNSKSELTQMGFLQSGDTNGITLNNFTASKSIPEPTTATLGLFGLMALLARRRRA
ncbi:MAG: MucBP domain-containing protein [Akkermansia sp.]